MQVLPYTPPPLPAPQDRNLGDTTDYFLFFLSASIPACSIMHKVLPILSFICVLLLLPDFNLSLALGQTITLSACPHPHPPCVSLHPFLLPSDHLNSLLHPQEVLWSRANFSNFILYHSTLLTVLQPHWPYFCSLNKPVPLLFSVFRSSAPVSSSQRGGF